MVKHALDGRTAVVTGAGRGIGRALALGLAAEGARVALVARTRDELSAVADEVRASGGEALPVRLDVADRSATAAAARQIAENLGPVDILIDNAAVVWPMGPSAAVDPAEWAAAIAINVVGVATLSFAVLPPMLERGWGRIVNVSTGAVDQPAGMVRGNAYVTGKAAVEAHTRNLAAELEGTGVTVNVYRPGGVDTAMQAWIRAQSPERVGVEMHTRFTRRHAEGALLTPEQAAASLLARLPGNETGRVRDVSDPL